MSEITLCSPSSTHCSGAGNGFLQIVRSQKREVVLAHCVWGRLPIRGHELIKNIAVEHCCIPSCGWQGSWWCDFECIIYVRFEHVIACLIDIFPCFEVVFNHGKFCVNGGFLFARIGYKYSFWVVFYWKCQCCCCWCNVKMKGGESDQDVHLW